MTFHQEDPLVSIITATYNRSNVLALTIKSILWQTFTDWELWVVGDACTDDTEQVVTSFGDPRIHFLNLEKNIGEQSGPNNAGFERTRGRFIAYLNHDDLWLPDHLQTALDGIDRLNADMIYTLIDMVTVDMRTDERRNILFCDSPSKRYTPHIGVPASCWLLRREMVEQVGSWRFYRECDTVPSQDWLFRAWKAHKKILLVDKMTVVAIPSGCRLGSYAKRELSENQLYYDRIRNEPDFRERELANIAASMETTVSKSRWLRKRSLKSLFKTLAFLIRYYPISISRKYCIYLGIHPSAIENFLRFSRKGEYIDYLRQVRGLKFIPEERRK